MKKEQIRTYVMRYLEATSCQIIEKSPSHVMVKLSPEADKALTNRSYYWSFVERTGADPETMTFTFTFDKEYKDTNDTPPPKNAVPTTTNTNSDSILGRYFGVTTNVTNGRVLKEHLTYGNNRLQQIFQSVKSNGKYVHLYEDPVSLASNHANQLGYSSWFVVNYKVEFTCDMKRDELHSFGISLSTGDIAEEFHDYLLTKSLTPKLPPNIHIRDTITLPRAREEIEKYLERIIKSYDHTWAKEAESRMQEELHRIESYYEALIQEADEDKKNEIKDQYSNRFEEIEWQYKPRIETSVINCGIFHLLPDSFHTI